MNVTYIDHMGSLRECKGCQQERPLSLYPVRNDRSGRRRPYCNECTNEINRARYNSYRRNNPFVHKCTRAKSRATWLKAPFDLTPEYLESIWTGVCPVFNIEIFIDCEKNKPNAAELDRINPTKGYVQGNVAFLSSRANRIKNDATLDELQRITRWLESQ